MSIEIWAEKYIWSDFPYIDGSHVRVDKRVIANVPIQEGIYDSEVGRIGIEIRRHFMGDRINEIVIDFMDDRKLRSRSSGKRQRCFHIGDFGLGYQELGINETLFVSALEGNLRK